MIDLDTDTLDEFDRIFGDLDLTILNAGERHRVFVYGTLMRGQRNHRLIMNEKFLGTAFTRGDYHLQCRMTKTGYPAPVMYPGRPQEMRGLVYGELYEVGNGTLMRLDSHEGHPEVYHRENVEVASVVDPTALNVWSYVYHHELDNDWSHITSSTDRPANHGPTGSLLYKWQGK